MRIATPTMQLTDTTKECKGSDIRVLRFAFIVAGGCEPFHSTLENPPEVESQLMCEVRSGPEGTTGAAGLALRESTKLF